VRFLDVEVLVCVLDQGKDVAHPDEFQLKVRVSGTSFMPLEGNESVGVSSSSFTGDPL
jgi:hypothetical protein